MRANIIYARKSSESEDRQILSVDAQVREMKALAARHGLEVSEVLTESRSAKAPGRPIFDALMRRVQKGQIGTLLSWKMDRLSRNHLDSGTLMHVLAEGFLHQIITIDGVKSQSGNDRLMGTVELAFATKFIDELRINTRRGTEERLRNGWAPFMPPAGYLNDRLNKTIVSDPERLVMIRRIFELVLSGTMRPSQILRLANDSWGFRTLQRKRLGGKPLSRSMLYEILGNAFYTGQIPFEGRLYPGKHEAIITWEEFRQVQTVLHRDGRQRPQRHEFAFTGLMKCGNCGGSITAEEHIKKSGRRFVYYRCSRHRVTGTPCHEPPISEPKLIKQFAHALGRLEIPEPVLEWMKRKVQGALGADRARGELVRKTLADTLRATEREIDNLLSLRLRDLVPDVVFASKTRELEERRAGLQERLVASEQATAEVTGRVEALLDFAAAARESFLQGSGVRQRAILEAVGLNYRLTGRKATFHLGEPLKLVADAGSCSNWYHTPDDLRTYFLNTTDYFKIPDPSATTGVLVPIDQWS